MTQLTENVFAVEVPEGAKYFDFEIDAKEDWYQLTYLLMIDDEDSGFYGEDEQHSIDIPPGSWQLLCTTREASEEQKQDIIDWRFESAVRIGFRNYLGGESDYSCRYSSESLNSLITSKGLDGNKNILLLEKL